MTHWLTQLELSRWDDLAALGLDAWLWTDIEGSGAHLEPDPPARPPADASLLWGWDEHRWVRVRADASAGTGRVVGAMLSFPDTPSGPGAVPVQPEVVELAAWAPREARVRLAAGVRARLAQSPRARVVRHQSRPGHWTELHFFSCAWPAGDA